MCFKWAVYVMVLTAILVASFAKVKRQGGGKQGIGQNLISIVKKLIGYYYH